ncbi:MAG: large repetitive protein, partial [Bradyrhizobium sp.]|nr:large repetitive protein [Bradyrhizobium sp.]
LGGGVLQTIDLRAGSPDGTDTLVNMESFAFTDGTFDAITVLITVPTTTVSTLAFSADTGVSNSDFITSTAAQTISGTLSANLVSGERVEVSLDNGATWTTAVAAVGANTFSLAGQTLAGSNVLEARLANSTSSGTATTQPYVLDTTAPGQPSTPVLTSGSDSGVQGDGITSVTTLTVTGAAEAGSTVKLYDTDGTTVLGTSVTTGDGTYSITSSTLSGGSHTLRVSATDAAGNVGLISSGIAATIDTTAPIAPTLTLAHDTGSSITDGITSDPTITVAAESGATLLYKVDSAASFSATAPVFAADGSADGSHRVLVEQQDAAGNISAASSLTFTLDTTAPGAPTLTLAHDTGSSSTDGITSDPTITVAAESGATLLYKVDGAAGFSTTAPVFAVDGSEDGSHTVLVEQQDAAGNTGAAAANLTFTLDTTTPIAPTLTLAHDTGSSAADGITSDPMIDVTAESGATLLYKVDGAAGFSATAPVFAVDGSADGSHMVLVEQRDAAGNIGAATSVSFTLDTTAPAAPTLALAHDTGSSSVDGITSDPTIAVAAESGATLLYKVDGAASFSTTAPDLTTDGVHTVAVEQQDVAGNAGAAANLTFTLDTTAPAAPTLGLAHDTGASGTDNITNDPTIVYTSAESGGVFLYKADDAANFSFAVASFATNGSVDGGHTVSVEQQDVAGNIGAASSLNFTLDTTAPHVTGLSASLANGTGGTTIDFTLTFNEAVKVIGGTPALALNSGNSAAYDAAVTSALGDSSKLVFDHLVAAGNTPVSFVEVAAFVPYGSVVVDIAGNTADVSHVAASFGHLSDDTFSPPHMPFAFDL